MGPLPEKVARVAGPPSPLETGVQAPHCPANTPAMSPPVLLVYKFLTVQVPISAMYSVRFEVLYTSP